MRPTLVDYLIVAEQTRVDVELRVYVGMLELGVISSEAGRVTYAELPGSVGDRALALLLQVPGTRVVAEPPRGRAANVMRAWRDLVIGDHLGAATGRAWRLDHVRAELDEIGASEAPAAAAPGADDPELAAITAELLDWAAADACLDEDFDRAHALMAWRNQLCPPDLVCASNLERLHLHLLEDEIVASLIGSDA